MPGINRWSMTGSIRERQALRYTPAGLMALDLVLQHQSTVQEQGVPRVVQLECRAVCLGSTAALAQKLPMGVYQMFAGFLAPSRNGRGLVYHITDIRSVPDSNTD